MKKRPTTTLFMLESLDGKISSGNNDSLDGCIFYICLSVHIMYIIHNKATFMVIDNINPIIRNSKNSTISTHLLALNIS